MPCTITENDDDGDILLKTAMISALYLLLNRKLDAFYITKDNLLSASQLFY